MNNGRTIGFRGDEDVKIADHVSGYDCITIMVRVTGGRCSAMCLAGRERSPTGKQKEEQQQQKQPLPMARATERFNTPFPFIWACGPR